MSALEKVGGAYSLQTPESVRPLAWLCAETEEQDGGGRKGQASSSFKGGKLEHIYGVHIW